jgi:hypothetical protein
MPLLRLALLSWSLCALALCGCSSPTAEKPNLSPALVELSTIAAGAECPAGGTRVITGIDTDGNGSLSEPEVRGAANVCNGTSGANGAASLVSDEVESAGANCATGGRKLSSGLDDGAPSGTAGNGTLEAGEVEHVSYVCNGQDGSSMLSQAAVEPHGANCTNGGMRVEFGLDDGLPSGTARNGALEPGEVQATQYVCDGADGVNGSTGSSSLVETSAEAAGANCPAGGTRVDTGLDDGLPSGTARNGVLEPGELDATRYVCNGASGTAGFNTLARTTAEPAGANCPAGGTRVDTGLDDGLPSGTAGNGVLEPGEFDATRYVCNGASGVSSLVKTTSEPGGANCSSGGVKVESGPDDGQPSGTANNGVLEAGEVTTTHYVCNGGGTGGAGLGVLKDANNQTLGNVYAVSTTSISVRSPTGYFYSVNWSGTFSDQQIYYSSAGCTGTMYLNAGTTSSTARYAKFLVYEGRTGGFFVPSGADANGLSFSVAFTAASLWNASSGIWQCVAGGSNGGWPLTGIARATAGMPATITPPLTIN